jgi:hypothetical protein
MSGTTIPGVLFEGQGGTDDTFAGTSPGDVVEGNQISQGNDTLIGGSGDDSLGGSLGNDYIVGDAGADTIIANGGDTVASESQGDQILLIGAPPNSPGNVLDGGQQVDVVLPDGDGTWNVSNDDGTVIVTDPNGNASTVSGIDSIVGGGSTIDVGGLLPGGSIDLVVCFAEGTRILTAAGEVVVEGLRGGDLLPTLGRKGAPLARVLWIGRRRIRLAGHPMATRLAPVRIKAGALADATPHRDLLVSPDHCLLLDGVLVPARLLVNGETIVAERGLAEVTYYHVELGCHDVLIAEGAAAESWLDIGNRYWFANADCAMLHVDAVLGDLVTTSAVTPCAEVIQGGPRLAAIRDTIALRMLSTGVAPWCRAAG